MGGVSKSFVAYNDQEQSHEFLGDVRTDFGGGFGSVRTQPWDGWNIERDAKGFSLVLKSDGKTYKFAAKTDDAWDSIVYQQDFRGAKPGEWEEVSKGFGDL